MLSVAVSNHRGLTLSYVRVLIALWVGKGTGSALSQGSSFSLCGLEC